MRVVGSINALHEPNNGLIRLRYAIKGFFKIESPVVEGCSARKSISGP
jgi:hypothetical protein